MFITIFVVARFPLQAHKGVLTIPFLPFAATPTPAPPAPAATLAPSTPAVIPVVTPAVQLPVTVVVADVSKVAIGFVAPTPIVVPPKVETVSARAHVCVQLLSDLILVSGPCALVPLPAC